MLAVPVILFSWIQNLDHLSPLSAVANLCLLTGIVVILYDEVDQMVTCKAAFQHNTTLCAPSHSPAQPRDPLFSLLSPAEFGLPLALFFGSVAFTYEAIGIVSVILCVCVCVVSLPYCHWVCRYSHWRTRCVNPVTPSRLCTLV